MDLGKFKEIAQKAGKALKYGSASLSFLNNNDEIVEYFCNICLTNPKNENSSKQIFLNVLNTEKGIMVVHYFMSKFYLFKAAEEEMQKYPDGYHIYQDDRYAYIVTELTENISEFTTTKTLEEIFLSEKTHCYYEKISDYVRNYVDCGLAVKECIERNEEKKYLDYFQSEYTYEKQILEPLSKACSYILNKAKYGYTYQNGMYIIALKDDNSPEQTGICLVIDKDQEDNVSIRKIVGRNDDGSFKTIEIPDSVVDFTTMMSKRTVQSA